MESSPPVKPQPRLDRLSMPSNGSTDASGNEGACRLRRRLDESASYANTQLPPFGAVLMSNTTLLHEFSTPLTYHMRKLSEAVAPRRDKDERPATSLLPSPVSSMNSEFNAACVNEHLVQR